MTNHEQFRHRADDCLQSFFREWVSDCCLTPTQQFFSYIMAKAKKNVFNIFIYVIYFFYFIFFMYSWIFLKLKLIEIQIWPFLFLKSVMKNESLNRGGYQFHQYQQNEQSLSPEIIEHCLIAYKISKFHQVWDNTLYLGGLNLTVETDWLLIDDYWQTLVFFLKLFQECDW